MIGPLSGWGRTPPAFHPEKVRNDPKLRHSVGKEAPGSTRAIEWMGEPPQM